MASTDDLNGTPVLIADGVKVTYHITGGRRTTKDPNKRSLKTLLGPSLIPTSGRRTLVAVKGVSFVANHGERIGIIGHNGAGKSTLLRALAGLLPLSGGAVYTGGTTSLLGVNAALSSSLTGAQNIELGCLAMGMTPQQVKEKYDDIVEFSGLGDAIDLPMRAYSSGMAARLRFAVSTAATSDILMIDEALATGDAKFRAKSMKKMEEVREHAGTVFLVSHNAQTITSFCNRAIWMEQGLVVADGPVEEIMERYKESLK
ncbi:ABC transporter ATP-binding protein [Demequina sp.]|uniref:ABC transporter ATP-binding protein n=1 Tax=Demequina sp. TaxID=2050685 RepID=UPI003D112A93